MPTFTEVIARAAIHWTPAEAEYEPICGVLRVTTPSDATEYTIAEFPVGWQGWAFQLAKLTPGTDPEADGYAVFVGPNGERSCECRGWLRWGHCRHVAAIEALLANGWL